jgi:serine/threonine-protein kinase HipA
MDDVLTLYRAVAFNWTIAGTDAHPRNYSVLIHPGPRVELAPLYDIASAVFLAKRKRSLDPTELRLAMAIGEQAVIGLIGRSSWEKEARAAGVRSARVLEAVEQTVESVPAAAERVAERARATGIDARFAERFLRGIRGQAEVRLAALRTLA